MFIHFHPIHGQACSSCATPRRSHAPLAERGNGQKRAIRPARQADHQIDAWKQARDCHCASQCSPAASSNGADSPCRQNLACFPPAASADSKSAIMPSISDREKQQLLSSSSSVLSQPKFSTQFPTHFHLLSAKFSITTIPFQKLKNKYTKNANIFANAKADQNIKISDDNMRNKFLKTIERAYFLKQTQGVSTNSAFQIFLFFFRGKYENCHRISQISQKSQKPRTNNDNYGGPAEKCSSFEFFIFFLKRKIAKLVEHRGFRKLGVFKNFLFFFRGKLRKLV